MPLIKLPIPNVGILQVGWDLKHYILLYLLRTFLITIKYNPSLNEQGTTRLEEHQTMI